MLKFVLPTNHVSKSVVLLIYCEDSCIRNFSVLFDDDSRKKIALCECLATLLKYFLN